MSHITPISMKVLTTLSAYRCVALCTSTSHNTVEYPAAVSSQLIGITADTVKDTINSIPVYTHGIAKLYMNETMATGLLVTSDTSGRGVPYVDNTAGGYVIGRLIGPAVSLTGTLSDILIQPFWKIIT